MLDTLPPEGDNSPDNKIKNFLSKCGFVDKEIEAISEYFIACAYLIDPKIDLTSKKVNISPIAHDVLFRCGESLIEDLYGYLFSNGLKTDSQKAAHKLFTRIIAHKMDNINHARLLKGIALIENASRML